MLPSLFIIPPSSRPPLPSSPLLSHFTVRPRGAKTRPLHRDQAQVNDQKPSASARTIKKGDRGTKCRETQAPTKCKNKITVHALTPPLRPRWLSLRHFGFKDIYLPIYVKFWWTIPLLIQLIFFLLFKLGRFLSIECAYFLFTLLHPILTPLLPLLPLLLPSSLQTPP